MLDSNRVQQLNEELARRIHEEARRNPQSPYANKCVGIANGRDVVTANDWDELSLRLRQIEPDPTRCFCAWIDPNTHFGAENEIWGLCRCRECNGRSRGTVRLCNSFSY